MSKFWTVAALLLVGALALLVTDTDEADEGISFTDLETECRYDRAAETNIELRGKRLMFSGNFPTENPHTGLGYDYTVSGSNIRLNIVSRDRTPLESFFNTCKASVIYSAETDRLEEGRYMVTVLHNRERKERVIIGIR